MNTPSFTIANIMLGRGLGGIEQAFLDYNEALTLAGHCVVPVHAPDAKILDKFAQQQLPSHPLCQWGSWDIFAAYRLRHLLQQEKVDAVIAHGNRALNLAYRAAHGRVPIITVSHNYKLQHAQKADVMLATTHDLRTHTEQAGMAAENIFPLPNMVRLPQTTPRTTMHNPPVIGGMGRMVAKKGFEVMLQALAKMRDAGVNFTAKIAGDGPEKANLVRLCHQLELHTQVEFVGWVANASAFYEQIDIFCLPSHHEPFGIVVLEAAAHGLPMISTATEGPREILANPDHGTLVPVGDASAMASALTQLCNQPIQALQRGQNAREYIQKTYDLPVVSRQLNDILQQVLARHLSQAA